MEVLFEGFFVNNIPRVDNEHANMLAKSAAQELPLPPPEVFLSHKSTFSGSNGKSCVDNITNTWRRLENIDHNISPRKLFN
jgi:hypothetical protein